MLTRRMVAVLLALVLLVAGGGLAWTQLRPDDPRAAATDVALDDLVSLGGPAGWMSYGVDELFPRPGQKAEQHGDLAVLVEEGGAGFTAYWTVLEPTEADCAALAEWTDLAVPSEEPGTVAADCRAAAGAPGVFTSRGTEPGPDGRYLFSATIADDDRLTAGLTYDPPS
ncbi:MAG: hypothetical protein ABW046_00725 [Actinoplanes sp.]